MESSIISVNLNEQLENINNYIVLTNKGKAFASKNNYPEALNSYQEALELAKEINDEYKINETNCNIAIIQFYLEELENALKLMESCFNYIYSICSNEVGNNNIENLYLLCRAGANYCMFKLSIKMDSMNLFKNIIDIINKEKDLSKQKLCSKYLNNALFKVNSLLKNKDKILFINQEEEEEEEEDDKYKKLLIKAFNNFISTQEYESWINSLTEISQEMEELNINDGLIYILFNQQIGICLKNNNNLKKNNENKEVKGAKMKLKSFLQAIIQQKSVSEKSKDDDDDYHDITKLQINQKINDEYINDIINEYNLKISTIRKIYQLLYTLEEKITINIQEQINQSNNNSKIDNQNMKFDIKAEYSIILLLKYTKNYLNKNIEDIQLKNSLIKNIDNNLDLINSKKIDLSGINMSSLDPDISQAFLSLLNELLNNIFRIYKKNKFKKFFEILRKKPLKEISDEEGKEEEGKEEEGKEEEEGKKEEINKIIKNFFESQYWNIYKGSNILKINYNSSGTKEYFYKVNNKKDILECFKVNDSTKKKPYKVFNFNKIIKVVVGKKTNNAIKKIKNLKIKEKSKSFLFLSLILKKKTLDLHFTEEEIAKNWFYGLFYYFKISNRNYKIFSCTKYILFKIKSKMINQLKDDKIKLKKDVTFLSCIKTYFNNYEKEE